MAEKALSVGLFFMTLIAVLALFMVNLDSTSQVMARDCTNQFIDDVRACGYISPSRYREYITSLAINKDFAAEITVQRTRKVPETDATGKPTGHFLYVVETFHNDEIIETMFPLDDASPEKEFVLEKGDTIVSEVTRTGAGFTSILGLLKMQGRNGDRIYNYSGSCYHTEVIR